MVVTKVLFEIPSNITEGLANGTLVQHGGVIREATGPIVAHLREIGSAPLLSPELASIVAPAVISAIQVAGVAVVVKELRRVEAKIDQLNEAVERIQIDLKAVRSEQILDRGLPVVEAIPLLRHALLSERRGDLEGAWQRLVSGRARIQDWISQQQAEDLVAIGRPVERLLELDLVCAAGEIRALERLESSADECRMVLDAHEVTWRRFESNMKGLPSIRSDQRAPSKASREGSPDGNPYRTKMRWKQAADDAVALLVEERALLDLPQRQVVAPKLNEGREEDRQPSLVYFEIDTGVADEASAVSTRSGN